MGGMQTKDNFLNYDEFIALADEWYYTGGDTFCRWSKHQFDDYTNVFGPITRNAAIDMFMDSDYTEDTQ